LEIIKSDFIVPFGKYSIHGDIITKKAIPPSLILLHGAGNGTRDRYGIFRRSLAEIEIGTISFDFIGFGDTGGNIAETSLCSRTEQVKRVVEEIKIKTPFSVLGASMGGYTAIILLKYYPIKTLILFVPAVYDRAAYQIPFGDEFSKAIRKPMSWINTDAWVILKIYSGNILLIQAENDLIIPEGVIHRIYESSISANKRTIYKVKNCPHLLIHYLSQHEDEHRAIISLIQQNL